MRVNLVSMQRVMNQGSFLQAYALRKLLSENGAEVRFSDIRPGIANDTMAEHYDEEFLSGTVKYYSKIKLHSKVKKQRSILLEAQKSGLELDAKEFDSPDLTVIGSDEVFNCLAPSAWGISKQLLGDVDGSPRTVSYAASCGHTRFENIPEQCVGYISKALSKFEQISVRDQNTLDFINSFGLTAECHLDPVLIYEFPNELKPVELHDRYMLIYSYSGRIHNTDDINNIKEFARKRHLKTVAAGEMQYWCDINLPVHPFELLWLFKNAEYVLTDTFHGAIMSMKYNKNMVCLIRNSNRNKLSDLLIRLGREDRIIDAVNEIETIYEKKTNYCETNRIIDSERERTRKYLYNILR